MRRLHVDTTTGGASLRGFVLWRAAGAVLVAVVICGGMFCATRPRESALTTAAEKRARIREIDAELVELRRQRSEIEAGMIGRPGQAVVRIPGATP